MNQNYDKILFGHAGRYGDICMGVPSFEFLRKITPQSKLLINIHKTYQDIAPLFFNNKYIDGVFISNEYENFPDLLDQKNLNNAGIEYVFHPMKPREDEANWFTKRHQVIDCGFNYGLTEVSEKINLNKWFNVKKTPKTIAFHATPGNYDKNNKKSFNKQKSQNLVDSIIKMGYVVMQVGSKSDEKLANTVKFDTDFFGSVVNILGCDLFIGGDSGLTWALSGYNFPVLAFYGDEYYIRNGINYIRNIQPINPNACYLNANNINNIPNDLIIDKIKSMV